MEKDLKEKEYLKYINEHISNVRMAYLRYSDSLCKALNISGKELFINVSKHDESKYLEEEFDGYRQYFHTCSNEKKDQKLFDIAWEHHYKNNKHHPEYWMDENGNPGDMPPIYIAEMLLDWEAMSMKFGGTTYNYYIKNRDKKPLSDNIKMILDEVIRIFR